MTTRFRKNHEASQPSMSNKRVANSWVLLVKEALLSNSDFSIVTLPHPVKIKPTSYCLDKANKKMYEVVSYREPFRSWFIDETVKSDGSMQLLTPMNPLFLVLPRLKQQCSDRAIPLEDLLSEKGFDKIIEYIHNMNLVADLKGPEDLKAYKYNETKTMDWLEKKIRQVAHLLQEKNFHVTSGAISATFVASNIKNESVDNELYLKYAYGLISEYLEDDICEKLEKIFDFKPDLIETLGTKRKSEEKENNFNNKKIKLETNGENCDVETELNNSFSFTDLSAKKQKPLTAKEKARQKAANGTKTISAFFTKK